MAKYTDYNSRTSSKSYTVYHNPESGEWTDYSYYCDDYPGPWYRIFVTYTKFIEYRNKGKIEGVFEMANKKDMAVEHFRVNDTAKGWLTGIYSTEKEAKDAAAKSFKSKSSSGTEDREVVVYKSIGRIKQPVPVVDWDMFDGAETKEAANDNVKAETPTKSKKKAA